MTDEDHQCRTCLRYFTTAGYYNAHLKYDRNLRCKLASENRSVLKPLLLHKQQRKRDYSRVEALLKMDFGFAKTSTETAKHRRVTQQQLENVEEQSDEDDDYAAGTGTDSDDDENMEEDTHENDADTDEAEEPCDEMLRDFMQYSDYANQNNCELTPETKAGIDLLHMLYKRRVPGNLYKTIYKWHLSHLKATKYVTKKKLVSKLEERYNMAKCRPTVTKMVLPHSKAQISLVCHRFAAQVQSLLTEPRITDEDFIFFNDNPFAPPPADFSLIGEVNTGLAYRKAYDLYITDPTRQVLCGIEAYMDGAVTGQYDHLPIEALKFTLSILMADTKDKEYAYRVLGYVNKFIKEETQAKERIQESEHIDTKYYESDDESADNSQNNGQLTEEDDDVGQDPEEDSQSEDDTTDDDDDGPDQANERSMPTCSQTDMHAMLDEMLASYREIEGKGMKWTLPYKGKLYNIELVFFVLFVKGDTVEHDKHCGHYGSRTKKISQLCRYCCCSNEDTDECYMSHKPKTQEMIQKLIDGDKTEELRALSQHNIDNAWYKVRFANPKVGIHGATPAEILHWIQLGWYKTTREMLFAQTGQDTIITREINVLAKMMGCLFKRQSERDIPRTSFAKVIKKGKLMAHEMTGLMVVLVAVLRSSAGRNLLLTKCRGNQKQYFGDAALISDWILLLETLLQFEAWLNLREISVYEVRRFKTKVREMMEMMKKIGQRSEGMGFKTFKFHVGLHIAQDMLNFGVPNNVNTKSNEMHHKDSKSAALKTQRRVRGDCLGEGSPGCHSGCSSGGRILLK